MRLIAIATFFFLSAVSVTDSAAQTVELNQLAARIHPGPDAFGFSVASDEFTILVGARGYGSQPVSFGPGAVFVFERDGLSWKSSQLIHPSVLHDFARFGFSVDVENGVAVVGAPGFGGSSSTEGVGAAFVFRQEDDSWVLEQQLAPVQGENGDEFGTAVSIGEDFIAVSSPERVRSDTSSGLVYLFSRDAQGWIQRQVVEQEWSHFGGSMDASGRFLVVGNHGLSRYAGRSEGRALLLEIENGYVSGQHELMPDSASPNLGMGQSVAINEGIAVVGVPSYDVLLDPGNIWNGRNAGAAYVFENLNGSWTHINTLLAEDPGTSDQFGWSMDFQNGDLLVGSIENGVLGNVHGSAYLFQMQDGELRQTSKLSPSPGESNLKYGWAVAISGQDAVVTTPNLGGYAYAYPNLIPVGNEKARELPSRIVGIESLWPNPFRSTVNLNVSIGGQDQGYLEVFDALGRRIHHQTLSWGPNQILKVNLNTHWWANGVYYFRTQSGAHSSTVTGVLNKR